MTYETVLSLVVLLPLFGALLNGFILRRAPVGLVCTVATSVVLISFLAALYLSVGSFQGELSALTTSWFPWIQIDLINHPSLSVPFSLTWDPLASVFVLVITGVGSLIHLYSGAYMAHEPRVYRFFVYLNLFIVSMLLLVLGDNMLVTFLGWEGVGACSYLLIGYWHESKENSQAAIKAFVVNRIGDVGFLVAMFICYAVFGTLTYSEIASSLAGTQVSVLFENETLFFIIGLLLLLAVTGKSAQIPLYTWLPDAMAGPTPVSALIHAATMVTAGIYLMARTSFLLVESADLMQIIAWVGGITAFFSATIAFAQNDIKKVLAYSTCSQLGYMVMACGVGAFTFGVGHVVTHAFFKACLFLGAGSVILALHHQQDIRSMGGLARKMPITACTFVIATLAIIGFPGFSGFFSKDAILLAALAGPFGHPLLWGLGVATAGLTAFYMLRLTTLVFFGNCRAEHPEEIHENGRVVTIPLVVLGLLSLVGGVIVLPILFTGTTDLLTQYLAPNFVLSQSIIEAQGRSFAHVSHTMEWGMMALSVALVLLAALISWSLYKKKNIQGGGWFTKRFPGFYRLVHDKWRIDELYDFIFVQPLSHLGNIFYKWLDRRGLDGVVQGLPRFSVLSAEVASDVGSGNLRNYLKLFFLGLVLFIAWALV